MRQIKLFLRCLHFFESRWCFYFLPRLSSCCYFYSTKSQFM